MERINFDIMYVILSNRACKAGEIDLIITKQVSRFARNVLDSLNYIFMLRKLDPPVGVYFEAEKLNTLDKSSDMVITVLSLVAQSESEQKSNSLKWSFKRRRAQGLGIYPNWALLGYMFDPTAEEDYHKWVIVEDEADVVRTIYSLYLEGYSSGQIADLLTKSGIPTVKGKDTWSAGSVLNMLRNEKYCGDALCQKTVTVDFFTHKSVRNKGLEKQYFVEGHRVPIIDKEDWLLARKIRTERRYIKRKARRHKPRVIVKGPLAGFIIADPTWRLNEAGSILAGLAEKQQPSPAPAIEKDDNIIIVKEQTHMPKTIRIELSDESIKNGITSVFRNQSGFGLGFFLVLIMQKLLSQKQDRSFVYGFSGSPSFASRSTGLSLSSSLPCSRSP